VAVLECKKKTVIKVDYGDLESHIKEIYGHELSIVADQETDNDESIDIVVKEEEIIGCDFDEVKAFVETGEYRYLLHTLMTHMCNEGHLEEGNYIISICW